MRGASTRRGGRRGNSRAQGAEAPPSKADAVDLSEVAATVARALAVTRAHEFADLALGEVMAAALPPLGGEVGIVVDRTGAPIATASAGIRDATDLTEEAALLLDVARQAVRRGKEAGSGSRAAAPLVKDGRVVGATAIWADKMPKRAETLIGLRFLAQCLASLAAEAGRANAAPPPAPRRPRTPITDRLVRALAGHVDGVALFDPAGGLITANAAFAGMHGATSQELKGLTLEEILRQGHAGLGPLLLGSDLRAGAEADTQLALAADGRWLRLSRRQTAEGDELVLQTPADDAFLGAAELRRLAKAAETREAEASLRWRTTAVGMVMLSRAGRIVEVNTEAARLLGAAPSRLVGRRLGKLAADATSGWVPIRQLTDGRTLALRARAMGDGRTLLALTDLPKAEAPEPAPVVAPQDDAVEGGIVAAQSLGELGHEMRTPLNAVIGFADVLLARSFGPLNDRQAQYLRDIGGAGRHMLEMVENMLDHAQIASGRYPFEPEWRPLPALLQEAVRLLEPAAAEKDVDLRVEHVVGAEAYVDRRSFLQAIINLVTNAVKFTPADGKVRVNAAALPGGAVRVSVADSGEGIPAADLDRVTEPFTQARRLGGRPLKGAGLGLSIVNAVAEMHDGRLDIESQEGVGTVAAIMLPGRRIRPYDDDAAD